MIGILSVTSSPCKQSWWVCLNDKAFHTEPTRREAMRVAQHLSKTYKLEIV